MIFLDNYKTHTYAAFRIILSFLFIFHGTQKLFSLPIALPFPLNQMVTAAGVIELVAGVLIMIGFYSRFAAFLASGTMAVAYWIAHGLNSPLPITNGGELSSIYCFGFLMIAANGPGIWSINKR